MTPTPPRLLPHHATTPSQPDHPRTDHRPPSRRQRADALRKHRAHPITLVLAACCALSPTLMTACANDTPTPQVSGTLPTQFMATTPNTSTTPTPTTGAPHSLSPELTAQRATALAMPKPTKPPQANQNDATGATNAVAYFFELYRYAFVTGDTTDLQAMSEEGCVFCQSTINDATKLHQNGGWANPWETSLEDLHYIPPGDGKEYCGIQGTIISTASTTIRGGGEIVEKSAEKLSIFVALKYADGAWTIKGVSTE